MKKVLNKNNIAIGCLCIFLGVIVSWQYLSVKKNNETKEVESMKLSELQSALLNEKNNNELLKERLAELQKENDKIKDDGEIEKQLKADLERAKRIAGLTEVTGEGVIVKLKSTNKNYTISDIDILNVVNEMRAGGAEAIAINDERVVATTEISQAANYIMVNGVRMNKNFTIYAIGNKSQLSASLNMLGGVLEVLKSLNIGSDLIESDKIVIPPVREDGTVLRDSYMRDTNN